MKIQGVLLSLAVTLVHAEPVEFMMPKVHFMRTPAAPAPTAPRAPLGNTEPESEPFWLDAKPRPLMPQEKLGAELGRMQLGAQLDRHRDLLNRQLGSSAWDISVAGDAAFNTYFVTFRQGAKLVIAPMGDINRLRN